jgi:hypothetical protein
MMDEKRWRRLEVGQVYLYVDGDDPPLHFTVLANRMNDNYRVFVHEDGVEEEWNLTNLFFCVYDV